jgi:hypothetical protein
MLSYKTLAFSCDVDIQIKEQHIHFHFIALKKENNYGSHSLLESNCP